MARVELLLGLVVTVVWIFSIVSCVLTPESEVRGIPKWAWLIAIVLLPLLGSVLWLGVGRERGLRLPRATSGPAVSRAGGPPVGTGSTYSALSADDRIRRMEEDLARLEREADDPDARPRG